MKPPILVIPAVFVAFATLAGCQETTPYPNYNPIYGARVSANPNPRGTAAFCRTYARQTAGNDYFDNRDSGEGIGYDLIQQQRARESGRRAYQRCLAGRTG